MKTVPTAMEKSLWAVYFAGHIHTDVERKLAIFATRKEAASWVTNHGTSECKVRKLTVFSN